MKTLPHALFSLLLGSCVLSSGPGTDDSARSDDDADLLAPQYMRTEIGGGKLIGGATLMTELVDDGTVSVRITLFDEIEGEVDQAMAEGLLLEDSSVSFSAGSDCNVTIVFDGAGATVQEEGVCPDRRTKFIGYGGIFHAGVEKLEEFERSDATTASLVMVTRGSSSDFSLAVGSGEFPAMVDGFIATPGSDPVIFDVTEDPDSPCQLSFGRNGSTMTVEQLGACEGLIEEGASFSGSYERM